MPVVVALGGCRDAWGMAHEIPVFKRRRVVAFEVGAGVSVSAFCRRLGISTRSFHRLRAAARAGGMEAIMPAEPVKVSV